MSETVSDAAYRAAVAESARRKETNKRLASQLEEAKKAREAMEAELKTWQAKASELESAVKIAQEQAKSAQPELAKQVDSLQREIKARDFKEAFRAEAKGKIRDDAIDAALKLYGGVPDEFTPESLGEGIATLVQEHAFLAAQSDPAVSGGRGPDASGKPVLLTTTPGPGIARPAGADVIAGAFKVTRDQLNDPAWMHRNQALVAKAAADQSLQIS
jgi:hypothetical protein